MKQRCLNPLSGDYPKYGGRGITMPEAWRDFSAFLADMGERPADCTLDRIDNDGPYSRDNCRWATRVQQANNTRGNRIVRVWGESMTLAEACRHPRCIVSDHLARRRVDTGWAVEAALTTPKRGSF